jgi:hypothetical protein
MRRYPQKLDRVAITPMIAGPMAGPASAYAVVVSATPTADQHVPAGNFAVRIELGGWESETKFPQLMIDPHRPPSEAARCWSRRPRSESDHRAVS